MRCLGLIGGLGVGSTVHYYEELVKAHVAVGQAPQLLMIHADMDFVLGCVRDGATKPLADYLAGLVQRLAGGGADIAAIPSITPHYCAPELIPISPLPLVNLVDEVAAEVRRRGLKRVALFGTRFVVESRLFGQLAGVDVVLPRPVEIELIHKTYFEIGDGRNAEEQLQRLRSLALTFVKRDGAEAIVLAGTELSLIFKESNTDFPHVDCTRLHLDAIMHHLG